MTPRSEILNSSVALDVAILHLLYENLKRSKRPTLSTLQLNGGAVRPLQLSCNLQFFYSPQQLVSFIISSPLPSYPPPSMQNKKGFRVTAIPEIISSVLSVKLQFWDRFKSDRDERSLIFFTPASVNPPPHISKKRKFLKPIKKTNNQFFKNQIKHLTLNTI